MEIYTAVIATISASASVFSLIKFWPRLTITVAFNLPRTTKKPIVDINIHNGKRHIIAIAKTGLYLSDNSEPFREHYHSSMGDTTVNIKPGGDYSEEWQIDSTQKIKYVWAIDVYGNRYKGNVPKSVTKQIRRFKPK